MKRFFAALCAAASLLMLWGCGGEYLPTDPTQTEPAATTAPTERTAEPTETDPPVTDPPQTDPPVTDPPETEPPHSAFYIPGVSVEDVILYFNEVCLDAEVVNGGDPSFLQKWTVPISYRITGEYTPEDMETLESFVAWLNSIDGFPGISPAEENGYANLRIHFGTAEDMRDQMGDWAVGLDGAVTFWYANDAIYDAVIC